MRKLRNLSILSLAVVLFATGCTKEGPEGPAGAQGPQGAAGAPGTPGAGITTYSAWFTTTTANWVDAYFEPYWAVYSYDKAAPGVTATIMSNGIVLSYMKDWTYYDLATSGPKKSASVVQLPYNSDIDFGDVYDFAIPAAGTIKYLFKSYTQYWTNDDIAGASFRYVIIAGSVLGGRGINSTTTYGGYTAEQLKAMPYEKVAQLFNIPPDGTNIR